VKTAAFWAISAAFLASAAWIVALNVSVIIRYYARGKHSSLIPLLGVACGVIGVLLAPVSLPRFWWTPFILDPGTILLAWMIPAALARDLFKGPAA
jgi:hypothetical protein